MNNTDTEQDRYLRFKLGLIFLCVGACLLYGGAALATARRVWDWETYICVPLLMYGAVWCAIQTLRAFTWWRPWRLTVNEHEIGSFQPFQ